MKLAMTIATMLAAWLTASDAARAEPPYPPTVPARTAGVLACPLVSSPPTVDGTLGDAAYERAQPLLITTYLDKAAVNFATEAWLCRDAENFYLAVRCRDEQLDQLSTGNRGSLLWKNDCVEVSFVPGRGRLSLTGSLGNVMQESAKAALTFVRSSAETLRLDCSAVRDVHIHVPEGAVPKDGPSAGLALTAALVSAYKGKPIDPRIALTGEITLRGRVLPVGGIKEKLLAAHREGVKKVIMPERNRPDLEKVPKEVLNSLAIDFVVTAEQAMGLCGLQ